MAPLVVSDSHLRGKAKLIHCAASAQAVAELQLAASTVACMVIQERADSIEAAGSGIKLAGWGWGLVFVLIRLMISGAL